MSHDGCIHLAAWLPQLWPQQNGKGRAEKHIPGEEGPSVRYMGTGVPACRSHRLHCCAR
jgi:hypothetical protein